jgi:hypothetical protein
MMMRTRTKVLLGTAAAGVIAAGLFAGMANAHGWGRGPGPMMGMGGMLMDQIDTDHDGKITKDELDGYIGTMFQKYDKNGASGLSQEDFAALLAEVTKPAQVRVFQFFDANGDGSITEVELRQPADRFFAAHEENGAIGPMQRGHHRRGPDGRGDEHERDDGE